MILGGRRSKFKTLLFLGLEAHMYKSNGQKLLCLVFSWVGFFEAMKWRNV